MPNARPIPGSRAAGPGVGRRRPGRLGPPGRGRGVRRGPRGPGPGRRVGRGGPAGPAVWVRRCRRRGDPSGRSRTGAMPRRAAAAAASSGRRRRSSARRPGWLFSPSVTATSTMSMPAAKSSDEVPPTPSVSSSGWGATIRHRPVDGVGLTHGRRWRSGGQFCQSDFGRAGPSRRDAAALSATTGRRAATGAGRAAPGRVRRDAGGCTRSGRRPGRRGRRRGPAGPGRGPGRPGP